MSNGLLRTAALLVALLCTALPSAGSAAQAEGAAAYSRKGADTCITCHEDKALMTIFRTPHGAPKDARSPFGPGQLQCEACHGPSDAHARGRGKNRPDSIDFGKGAETPVAVQNAQCLTCHNGPANHWASSAHAASEVSCADCHDSHALHDPMKKAVAQNETCTTCHKAQHTQAIKPYGHPLAEGKMACTSCHAPHGSNTPAHLVKNTVNETCTTCHADLRGPFLWEHQPVAEDCGNCHDPHGSTNPGLLKARGPFQCQQCHQASGHPSLSYGPNNLPGRGGANAAFVVAGNCQNCHTQVHGSNHPSGSKLMR